MFKEALWERLKGVKITPLRETDKVKGFGSIVPRVMESNLSLSMVCCFNNSFPITYIVLIVHPHSRPHVRLSVLIASSHVNDKESFFGSKTP